MSSDPKMAVVACMVCKPGPQSNNVICGWCVRYKLIDSGGCKSCGFPRALCKEEKCVACGASGEEWLHKRYVGTCHSSLSADNPILSDSY